MLLISWKMGKFLDYGGKKHIRYMGKEGIIILKPKFYNHTLKICRDLRNYLSQAYLTYESL